MRSGVVAKKIGMTSYLNDSTNMIGVTFLKIEDCVVVDIKSCPNHLGFSKIFIGYSKKKNNKKSKKPLEGFFKKSNIEFRNKLKEFKASEDSLPKLGDSLKCEYFLDGQFVDVRSKSIGKGFAGGMKRHNFKGLEATHGVSVSHRSHGSTGGCQDPGRVFKNKKMAGHLGNKFVTVQNLQVIGKREKENILILKGSVPGPKGGYVYLTDAIKKNF
ncbi:MAG: 50S ribosomal protein L3 [Rickettsia sp.]|nr:50S ribosomal protein L3 [Rickettsia sp.]